MKLLIKKGLHFKDTSAKRLTKGNFKIQKLQKTSSCLKIFVFIKMNIRACLGKNQILKFYLKPIILEAGKFNKQLIM